MKKAGNMIIIMAENANLKNAALEDVYPN